MLKAILYLSLSACGISATFVSPFAGVLTCLAAYLLNPVAFEIPDGGFRYQFWTALALILSVAVHRPKGTDTTGTEVWIMRLMWAFVVFAALTSTWAVVSSEVALTNVYEVFKTVLLVSCVVRIVREPRQMSTVVTVLVIGVWHAAIVHVLGVRFGYARTTLAREVGVLPDSQTAVMALFVPLLILMAMFGTRTQRVLSWCALPFVLDSIVGTYERTGFVMIGLEAILLLIYLPKRITLRLSPLILAGAGLFVYRFTPEDYWDKMSTIRNPTEEASANSRFTVNEASKKMFVDYPMGVGYRNYPYVSPRYLADSVLTQVGNERLRGAHNSYFTVLCETGFFGFALWISIFGVAIRMFRRIRKSSAGDTRKPPALTLYSMAFEIGLYGWAIGGGDAGVSRSGSGILVCRICGGSNTDS